MPSKTVKAGLSCYRSKYRQKIRLVILDRLINLMLAKAGHCGCGSKCLAVCTRVFLRPKLTTRHYSLLPYLPVFPRAQLYGGCIHDCKLSSRSGINFRKTRLMMDGAEPSDREPPSITLLATTSIHGELLSEDSVFMGGVRLVGSLCVGDWTLNHSSLSPTNPPIAHKSHFSQRYPLYLG